MAEGARVTTWADHVAAQAQLNKKLRKVYSGPYYGSCDLGVLATANNNQPPAEINLFANRAGNGGSLSTLGIANPTASDTNVPANGQMDASTTFVMTGIGAFIEPVCAYDPEEGSTPNPMGTLNPSVMAALLRGYRIVTRFDDNSSQTWGPLDIYSAGDAGPRFDVASQTTNNGIFTAVSVRGVTRTWSLDEAPVFPPTSNFNHLLMWGGDPA
ncbi:MAG: hypothetical protein KIH64_004365, partial [Mycobacterium sp.]|nr:hypothetical protein [Mycobacterium sp.]